MLNYLSIQDFVIVDRLELDFGRGFTVLTGETGAGKSILIDALGLVLGERGDSGVVRGGSERAELVAEFSIDGLPALQAWLGENDLGGDPGLCLMRRVIDAGGRSRAFINGRPATLQQLREAGEWLVDIHGQHAHQSLLRQDAQRDMLDAYAGASELCGQVSAAHRRWQELQRLRLEREKNAEAFAAEREELDWQVRELRGLSFTPEGWQDLLAEHARLAHAASLLEGAQFSLDTLSEGEMACLSQLSGVIARLGNLQEYDPGLRELLEILVSAEVQVQEAVYGLRHYLHRLDLDPERLAQCESRLDEIHSAARKYRTTPEQLPELLLSLESRLDKLVGVAEGSDLAEEEQRARRSYRELAEKLSAARAAAAQDLSRKVSAAMDGLAMPGGQFEAALAPLAEGGPHGLERIEFLVSAHPGQPLKPLAKVASGGELSRISLAIQVVASKASRVPTLIFDEVDVGIGGGVAEIVGKMLRQLGAERQVLCITHLPQVAALGDRHLRVAKIAREGAVLSRISVLDEEGRVDEVARMLGGVDITNTTRRHAEEMLGAGRP